jgi:hypothetical protein
MVFGISVGVGQVHLFLVLLMLFAVSLTRMEMAFCTFLWRERLKEQMRTTTWRDYRSGYYRHSITLGPRDAHRRHARRNIDKRLRKGCRFSSKVHLATATSSLIMRPKRRRTQDEEPLFFEG